MFGRLLMSSQFPNKILLILLLLVFAQYHFSLLSVRFSNITFSIGFSISVKQTTLFLPFNLVCVPLIPQNLPWLSPQQDCLNSWIKVIPYFWCSSTWTKAFDSVPHRPLLELLSKLNLPGNLLAWLLSYLTSHSQQGVVNEATSLIIPVISGVPQGSILGPLLCILYVNDIFQLPFSSSSTVILYADDIFLSCPIKLPSDILIIQSDINTLSSWAKHKFLTFNHSKTKYMLISHKRPASLYCLPRLTLDGTSLEQVSSFKYLGVALFSTLSWSTHISLTCSKAKKQIGYIYQHFYTHSSPQSLLKLYMSIVLPVLSSCSLVCDPHTLSDISKLEKVQHFALKMCSRKWSADYHSLLLTFNIPCLSSHCTIAKHILPNKFIYKQMYIPENFFFISLSTLT